jgi:hypothetical protein
MFLLFSKKFLKNFFLQNSSLAIVLENLREKRKIFFILMQPFLKKMRLIDIPCNIPKHQ